MFYLETKDGERFLTDAKSDDKAEFRKIIEQKLGSDAAVMFDEFIDEAECTSQSRMIRDIDSIIYDLENLKDLLQRVS